MKALIDIFGESLFILVNNHYIYDLCQICIIRQHLLLSEEMHVKQSNCLNLTLKSCNLKLH